MERVKPLAFVLLFQLCGCASAPPKPPPELPRVVERPSHTAHANGVELAWDDFGDSRAPALLLIQGLGLQMIAWPEELCERLAARGFHVIRFDNRDAGRSTHFSSAGDPNVLAVADALAHRKPVRAPYSIADLADDAAALLEAIGVDAAHVVGVSMGGMIAQELALRHPERVKTLVSIMSTTGDPNLRGPSYELSTSLLKPFPDDRAGFVRRSVEVARAIAGRGFPFDEELVRQIAARSYDRDHDQAGVRRQLVAIFTQRDRHAALATLHIPTLVIHGGDDPLVPVDAGRATASAIPGSRLEIIAGMGHELPRAVWPRVIDLMTQLDPGAARH